MSSFSECEDSDSVSSCSPMSISSAEANSPYSTIDDSELSNERLSPSSPPATPSTTSSDDDNWAPYQRPFNGAKSVRWFRDDRGLWSEHTRASPYQRPPRNK